MLVIASVMSFVYFVDSSVPPRRFIHLGTYMYFSEKYRILQNSKFPIVKFSSNIHYKYIRSHKHGFFPQRAFSIVGEIKQVHE